ncbi:MAG: multidrug efflux SMR transporter [Planctomycetota bacterium]
MPWVYLLLAGLFEIGWPVGLKVSQMPGQRWVGIAVAVGCMAASGTLLWMAQRTIPIGTAYAVWTGVGASGTFVVGVLIFGDASSVQRWVSIALIVAGIVGLKLAHQ